MRSPPPGRRPAAVREDASGHSARPSDQSGGHATRRAGRGSSSEQLRNRSGTEIRSWRQHTGDNVHDDGRLLFTSRHEPVAVETGRGSYFSFVFKSDRDAEEGTFEWLGVTRRGTAVSIVAWRVDGQDATYEVDPTIASVKAANAKLARLG